MKCIIDSGNKEDKKGVIVRRKFVPLKFTIHRENQFLNAAVKLPFTTAKVIGVLTTSNSQKPCSDTPILPRLYYGLSDTLVDDDRFLTITPGVEYAQSPPDARLSQDIYTGLYWYYAHPVTDDFPWLYQGELIDQLTDPQIISILPKGRCTPVEYYLWSDRFIGYLLITHQAYT